MVSRDGAAIRRGRIQHATKQVLSTLQRNNGVISLSRTLAVLQYEIGLTRDKLMEYLTIAADAEFFVIDVENDKIKSVTES